MRLYRLLIWLLSPLVVLWLLWRRATGRDSGGALDERLGRLPPLPATDAPRLWLHGASNGELTSARWLVTGLVSRSDRLLVTVTCNTETARAMVRGWGLPRVEAHLAPLDLGGAVRRFLDRTRPRALLILENELWPGRIAACADRGIPVLVAGARMSEKSARVWQRAPALARQVMAGIRWLSAQDAGSEARFRALGLSGDRAGPPLNLKARPTQGPEPGEQPLADDLRAAFHPARTVLAASTHEGEDAILLDAFARALAAGDADRLILAPRHPRRAAEILRLVEAAGLSHAQRSQRQPPDAAAVYLADTLGEMELWYRLAGVTFVGGSLVPAGGHTPYEPARFGSAILHGPQVANFAEVYAELDRAEGARQVTDAAGLAAALAALADPALRARMAARAQEVLAEVPAGGEMALCDALATALGLPDLHRGGAAPAGTEAATSP